MNTEQAIKNLEGVLSGPLSLITGDAPWLESLRQGETTTAITLIENQLHDGGYLPENRLWWIYAQLTIKQVPIMALAAPLEEIDQHFKSLAKVSAAVIKVYLQCALLLQQKNQFILSSRFFAIAIEYLKKCDDLDQLSKQQIKNDTIALLSSALSESENDPRRELEYKEIKSALSQINNVIFEHFAPENNKLESIIITPPPTAGVKSHFSAKSILEFEEDREDEKDQVAKEGSEKANLWRFSAFAAAIGSLVVAGIFFIWLAIFGDQLSEKIAIASISPSETLLLPNIDQKDFFQQEESERIVSDLKALSDKLKNIAPENDNSNQPVANNSEPASTEEKNEPASIPQKTAEVVKDEDLYYQPGTFGDPLQKQPRIDPKEILSTKVEQLDINKNVNRLPQDTSDLREGADGRRYGREVDDKTNSPYNERRDLNGQPLQSLEVTLIEPPAHYRTITATDVLSHPSFVSRSLIRLDSDATILVVAKMGQWLEIRSAQGRRGYVLAQDAVEEIAPKLD